MNVMEHQKNGAEHTKSHMSPLLGLLPTGAFWAMTSAYLYLQPIILREHLIPFVFLAGLINAYMVGKIIIAHLTRSSHFPYRHSLMFPLAFGVVDSVGPKLGLWPSALGDDTYQIAFMFMCLGIGVGVYGSFVVCLDTISYYPLPANPRSCSTMSSQRSVTIWTFGASRSSTQSIKARTTRSRNDFH